jgi:hypothetical protein
VNWRHFDFYDVINILSKFYVIHYKTNEEKIALIESENNIIGYLCLNYPIFFIKYKNFQEIQLKISKYNYLQCIVIDSIVERSLKVDRLTYGKYFNYMDDIDNFSAEEFYFYNVI